MGDDDDDEVLLAGGVLQEDDGGASRVESGGFDELRDTLVRITTEWRGRARARQGHRKGYDDERRAPWRKKLEEWLESTAENAFILGLLLLDLLATVIDVLHTLRNDSRDLSRCVAMLEACRCARSFELSQSWEFLYWISIATLCVLALNILGLLLALGLTFFRHPGYVLDLIVVVTALCLEIFLDTETAGLLVILNLWRIIRIAHGVFEVIDEAWEKKIHQLEGQIQAVEAAHHNDMQTIHRLQHRLAELQQLIPASYHDQEVQY